MYMRNPAAAAVNQTVPRQHANGGKAVICVETGGGNAINLIADRSIGKSLDDSLVLECASGIVTIFVTVPARYRARKD
jgi:hypothetical protein